MANRHGMHRTTTLNDAGTIDFYLRVILTTTLAQLYILTRKINAFTIFWCRYKLLKPKQCRLKKRDQYLPMPRRRGKNTGWYSCVSDTGA